MQSISHALRITQTLKQGLHAETTRADNRSVSKEEAAESAKLHAQTTAMLKNSIASIETTLRKIRQNKAAKEKQAGANSTEAVGTVANAIKGELNKIPKPSKPTKPTKPKEPSSPAPSKFPPSVQNILNTFGHLDNKVGFGKMGDSIEEMISSIEPIIDTFDSVLVKPFIERFNATLDTVPVVGLRNEQVFYLANVKDKTASAGIKLEWRHFSGLPTGFQLPDPIPNGNSTYYPGVHLFPYTGHLFISNGRSVWRMEHLGPEDEALAGAVDDYSKLYQGTWQEVGNNVLPEANIRNIVPFFEISPAGQQLLQKLVILHEDSSLSILREAALTSNPTWDKLTFDNILGVTDKWERIAYWNNKIIAITTEDNKTYSQNLHLDLSDLKYKIGNKALIDPVLELTATEVGPVAIQNDGTMRIRRIDEDQLSGDEPTEDIPDGAQVPEDLFIPEPVEWETLAPTDGVTNIGIASAGVILNLNLLTRVLKLRYVDSQLALYPVITRFRSFALVHKLHLEQIKDIAESFPFPEIPDDGAIQVSTRLVNHAKQWSSLLSNNIAASNETVVLMARQLDSISEDIEIQLENLKDELTILQGMLDESKDQLKKYRAAFIGTLITGILVIAAAAGSFYLGLLGPKVALTVGFIGVGFIIAAGVTGSETTRLRGEVERGEQNVRDLRDSIEDLSFVSGNFVDLEGRYDSLKQFWGLLNVDAQTIDQVYLPLMAQDIFGMLLSPELYQEALNRTQAILDASQKYLDTLHAQGIILPPNSTLRGVALKAAPASGPTADDMIEEARVCLETRDFDGYEAKMRQAVTLDKTERAELRAAIAKTGIIFDVPQLRAKASVFHSPVPFKSSAVARSIQTEVTKASKAVAQLLDKTIEVCGQTQEALDAWRASNMEGIRLEAAMLTCKEGLRCAAQANNALVKVNHMATDYQHDLEREIAELRDNTKVTKVIADEKKKAVAGSAPWYIYSSPVALTAWVVKKKNEISKQLEMDLSKLNASINDLRQQILSGSSFLDKHLTWKQMVQEISQRLGDIYAVLDAIQLFVVEVPEILEQKDFASIQWDTIAQDAQEVRAILAGQGIKSNALKLARTGRKMRPFDRMKTGLIKALKPADTLESNLAKQARDAENFFGILDELVTTPILDGIFANFYEPAADDEDDEPDEEDLASGTMRQSISEVAVELRQRFADAGGRQLNTVGMIEAMALLQKLRVQYYKDGKHSLVRVLDNAQFFNDRALDEAVASYNYYVEEVKTWFEGIVATMKTTLSNLQDEIAEIDENIEKLEEQQRKNIISLVAKVVALSFTLASAVVSLGALSPTVAARVAAGKFAKQSFKVAKKTVKVALESSDIREVRKSILALKSMRRELDLRAQRLEDLLPTVNGAEIQLGGFNGVLEEMREAIADVKDIVEEYDDIELTEEDITDIHASWDGVIDGANQLAGVIHAAGITPF